ncbi:hypothetical protein GCM10023317_26200 [Actinopolymorpha pittospori]|uniref:Outer membrane protein assembly factor BamB n=1 Tax=Actinopolymorpha pittospori TaxID=648752 RepID=A0A927MU48_9ACTN|nr:outer membrane protein assembly factor BamB [Actinopolymorpha pittospori]
MSTHHGNLAALDAQSGAVRWRRDLGGFGDALAVADGQLYVASSDAQTPQCRLRALDAANGTPRWSWSSQPCSRLLVGVADGLAYLTTAGVIDATGSTHEPARVMALDADTGRQRWSVHIDSPNAQVSAPVVAARTVYVTTSAELVALAVADGSVRWRVSLDGGSVSPPVIHGSLVHVVRAWGYGESAMYAFDAQSGQQRWVSEVREVEAFHAPVVAADAVVVVSQDAQVRGLDHRTGRQRWVRAFGTNDPALPPAPAFSSGTTVYVRLAGKLLALDAMTGRTRWTNPNPTPGDPLGANDDVVYLADTSGVISAIGAP